MKKFNIVPFADTREANPFTCMCLHSLTGEFSPQLSSFPSRLRNNSNSWRNTKVWAGDKDVLTVFICKSFPDQQRVSGPMQYPQYEPWEPLLLSKSLPSLLQSPPLDTVSLQTALISAQCPLECHIEDTGNRSEVQVPMENRRHWFQKEA